MLYTLLFQKKKRIFLQQSFRMDYCRRKSCRAFLGVKAACNNSLNLKVSETLPVVAQ